MSTQDKVIDIVCMQLGYDKDKVSLTSDIVEDLGADSLDGIELVMELEEAFDIEIPDADAEKLTTVQEICDYLREKYDLV